MSKERIESIVNEWIKGGECFLVDVKSAPGKIAVFIDKPTGITLDECSSLNHFIVDALEPEGFWENHELEVSSPGMEQPLKVLPQYQRRIGREVRIITIDGREHKGKLQLADDKGVEILEMISKKENNKKISEVVTNRYNFDTIKETKLILSFKI